MSERILELFQKHFSKTISLEEKRELDKWIAHNEDLQCWLDKLLVSSSDFINEEQQKRILNNIHESISKRKSKIHKFIFPIKSVAVLMLILISIGSVLTVIHINNEPVLYTEVVAMRGQKASVTLPDGTKVKINSESKLIYGTDFKKKNRTIQLDGEAYFDITPDKKHPFIVKAGEISVKALGTEFNIRAYSDENNISTTLTEGKVEIKTPLSLLNILPNERLEYNRNNKNTNLITLDDAKLSIGWLIDQLSFENATLADVVNDLSRIYNVDIKFSSESIKHQRFTGTIHNNSLQSVLRILLLTSPIQYKIENNCIVFYKNTSETKLF